MHGFLKEGAVCSNKQRNGEHNGVKHEQKQRKSVDVSPLAILLARYCEGHLQKGGSVVCLFAKRCAWEEKLLVRDMDVVVVKRGRRAVVL
jgi:hypothetical protein